VGAWFVGMAAVDRWGAGLSGWLQEKQILLAPTMVKAVTDMWLRGRSYKRQQSVVRFSGRSVDRLEMRQELACSKLKSVLLPGKSSKNANAIFRLKRFTTV
jgi:hypothetical protein